jgi:hypothetical protein
MGVFSAGPRRAGILMAPGGALSIPAVQKQLLDRWLARLKPQS